MVKGLTWSKLHHTGFKALLALDKVAAFKLFVVMVLEMTRDGLVIAPRKRLARMAGTSERAVSTALDALIDIGAITREGRGRYRVSPWFVSYGKAPDPMKRPNVVIDRDFYVVDKKTGEVLYV